VNGSIRLEENDTMIETLPLDGTNVVTYVPAVWLLERTTF
jgi:hypothetical protein